MAHRRDVWPIPRDDALALKLTTPQDGSHHHLAGNSIGEAASSLGLYLSKSVTFQHFGALTPDIALKGLIAGSSLMSGAFIAKRFVLRLDADVFRLVMDGIMLAAG